ncbi:MAG: peptide chain release factor 2 [Fusicatenibacter sp.]|nr:peptide chain release factor 2 [Lachnospiraceae bacterium]MDY2937059.1 peptide chain release factor 2 [Fusicatenibacter sp.]
MVELDQFKSELNTYDKPLVEVRDSLDLANKEQRIEELERKMEEPDFWDRPEEAQNYMKQLSSMKEDRDTYQKLVSAKEDMETLIEMGYEENDPSVIPEIQEMLDEFKASFDAIRIKTLLSGEFDTNNAIIKLNAGAGGTEACDWCGMLYRMYTRWAERKGFSIEELDFLDGDEAGVKSVTFQVNGENAYGYLKSEKGVHRLVRISPFNAAGKRQTSFVSCDVMPDIDKEIDVEVRDEDIRIDTYRSSGAGGQHINKTSSAIRITHMPTGIVVTCQNERSQFQNKDKAMQMLKAKLYMLKLQEQAEKLSDIRGEVTEIGWGNQIRSYVMQPYTMVKDHRTNAETGNVDAVMDGSIDLFVNAYLKWIALGTKENEEE